MEINNELKQKLLNGELSIRDLSKKTHKDREVLKRMFIESAESEDERLLIENAIKENKKSSAIKIDENLKETLIRILKGELSERQAAIELGIDRETIRRKTEELANSSPKYVEYYISHKSIRGDYSDINFRRIFTELIEENMTQEEIAKKYSIPTRTISRELEKLGKSEDPSDTKLYELAKIIAEKHLRHENITDIEMRFYGRIVREIKSQNKFIEIEEEDSVEKNLRQLEEFVIKVRSLEAKGLSQQKIAEQLHVGISTIRRRKLRLKELKGIEEKKKTIDKNEREY